MVENFMVLRKTYLLFALLSCSFILSSRYTYAEERTIIQLRDFSQTEVKSGGFTLSQEMPVHITARGAGASGLPFSNDGMYAYGWIINADTRETVWKMTFDNTTKNKSDRTFDADVPLKKGSYEVYFSAYGYATLNGFSSFNFNFDRRKDNLGNETPKHRGFLDWLEEIFGGGQSKDWKQRSQNWGIDLTVNSSSAIVPVFTPPKEFPHTLFQAIRLGVDEHIQQRFVLNKPIAIHIYAIGERSYSESLADYGWIIDIKTHKRLWEMTRDNLRAAGGADKNVKFDDVVEFPAGEFILYYVTDDSHSFTDWNAAPPDDPINYGVSLLALNENDKAHFTLSNTNKEEKNIIVQMTKVGNSEMLSKDFTLKENATLRVYALGERSNGKRQMADYGWIMNARTREKVWTMDADRTEPAGGADKNRMIDEVITLPKGSYTVFYQTDDSHAYNAWNDSPPYDPDHWGITVYGDGDSFNMNNVVKNSSIPQENIVAQIIRVGNNANSTKPFSLDKPTRIRIYAIGEGQNNTMYDYGWIKDENTGTIVWEMTYSMTFHAGGGRKNRMVNTTIVLDKGNYVLHFVSDDSHSYGNWNTDPPDDPTMWGITLYKGE